MATATSTSCCTRGRLRGAARPRRRALYDPDPADRFDVPVGSRRSSSARWRARRKWIAVLDHDGEQVIVCGENGRWTPKDRIAAGPSRRG
jgi:hypothetical protein